MKTLNNADVRGAVRRLPAKVKEILRTSGPLFLAGGYIRSCITREPVSDIDLFSATREAAMLLANCLSDGKCRIHQTDNAVSLNLDGTFVQFITRWTFQTPAECVESFDFTIASAAIWWDQDKKEWQSCCDDAYYPDLAAKRLTYRRPIRNEDAGGSMLRVLKFYQRGYRITLPSLGAVMARCVGGVRMDEIDAKRDNPVERERLVGKAIAGLLKEVDPNSIDPDESAYEGNPSE